jgi:hypothetical protein
MSEIAAKLHAATQKAIDQQKPTVLLLGPTLGTKSDGSILRKELKERIWGIGVTVLAEHDDMKKVARKSLKSVNNLARLELHIAKIVDLVVIIPDSPGSFAELGMFAIQRPFCHKMVMLLRKEFKKDKSYIQLGPRKYAEELRAEPVFIDYKDIDSAWKILKSFVYRAKAEMADRYDITYGIES